MMMTTSRPVPVVGAIIEHKGKILLCKRPAHGHVGGLWEIPGGKIEYGESPEEALRREITEELGMSITVHELVGVSSHLFPAVEKHFVLIYYRCTSASHEFTLHEHDDAQWVDRTQVTGFALTPGTAAALDAYKKNP